MNLRELILAANDLKTKKVFIPEWNLELTVRELSGGERDEIFRLHAELADISAVCRTIEIGAVDENGDRVFEDGDAEKLAGKSDTALTTLYSEIMKLSGCNIDKEGEDSQAGKPLEKTENSGKSTDSCTSLELGPTQS